MLAVNGSSGMCVTRDEWLRTELRRLQGRAVAAGLRAERLKRGLPSALPPRSSRGRRRTLLATLTVAMAMAAAALAGTLSGLFDEVMAARCLLPNNYLVWEATRPLSDCSFCQGVTEPLILHNISREDFKVCYILYELLHTLLFSEC